MTSRTRGTISFVSRALVCSMSKFSAGMPPSRPPGATSCRRSRISSTASSASSPVGVAAEDEDDHGLRRLRRGGTGSASCTVSQLFHPARDLGAVLGLDHRGQRRAEAGGEVAFERFGAAAGVGRVRLALAEADRAVVGQVAEREDGRQGEDGDDDRPERRRTRPATRSQRRGRAQRRVSRSRRWRATRGGQKARSPRIESRAGRRVKAAASITAIPIASIGPEPVGRLQVGDQQHQHRRDHGPARGGDRRAVSRSASRAAPRPPAPRFAALPGSDGPAAASSRCRRRRSAPGAGRSPRC